MKQSIKKTNLNTHSSHASVCSVEMFQRSMGTKAYWRAYWRKIKKGSQARVQSKLTMTISSATYAYYIDKSKCFNLQIKIKNKNKTKQKQNYHQRQQQQIKQKQNKTKRHTQVSCSRVYLY